MTTALKECRGATRSTYAPPYHISLKTVLLIGCLVSFLDTSCCKTKRKSLLVDSFEPADDSVTDRGLVSEQVSYRSILKEHGRYWANTSHRNSQGSVLGYVTPWNKKGYEVAVKFRNKFTHVSPVWYQLRRGPSEIEVTGSHEVDRDWMTALRQQGSSTPRIVPRVVIEGHPLDTMLTSASEQKEAIRILINECEKEGYDGLVLEAWSAWANAGVLQNPKLRQMAIDFVNLLGTSLQSTRVPLVTPRHHRHMQLIFTIPPPTTGISPQDFTPTDIAHLSESVSAFVLMTYDYSNPSRPGPNAPLPWIQATLKFLLPFTHPTYKSHLTRLLDRDAHKSHTRELKSVRETKIEVEGEGGGERGEGGDGEGEGGGRGGGGEGWLWLGVQFFGNNFVLPQGGGPIVGHEYLKLLDDHRPKLEWDPSASEHYFNWGVRNSHRVYFPTLQSLAMRLDEAKAWGVGISIWELGQGLDYWYDLL